MKLLLTLAGLIAAGVTLRLADLQIRQAKKFRDELEKLQIVPFRPIPARRGRILAKGPGGQGTVELVADEPAFELAVFYPLMDPDNWWRAVKRRRIRNQERAKNPTSKPSTDTLDHLLDRRIQQFWDKISQITKTDPHKIQAERERIVRIVRRKIRAVQKKLAHQSNSLPNDSLSYPILEQRIHHPILTGLEEAQKVELTLALTDPPWADLADEPWATVRPGTKRIYRPRSRPLCHILGRTYRSPGAPPKTFEMLDDEHLPGELRGKSQLERAFDDVLKGQRGWVALTDPPEFTDAIQGKDVTLTIDIELQERVERSLIKQIEKLRRPSEQAEARDYPTGGAAVVIDLSDQSLLALASVPTFNPGEFSKNFKELVSDYRRAPLRNRALTAYPPGSTVKPIVAVIALQCKAIPPSYTSNCPGYLIPGVSRFRCWKSRGHGDIGLVEAISQSCDVFFYRVGEKIGAGRLARYYREFGLGVKPVGFNLPCKAGLVPDQRWSIEKRGHGLRKGDARNLAVGQGDLLITPLHAAIMFAALLTGELRPIKLVENDTSSAVKARPLHIDRQLVEIALEGMERAVNDESGTAYDYAHSDAVKLAGKTGSAQAPPQRWWVVTYKDSSGQQHSEETYNLNGLLEQLQKQTPPPTNISYKRVQYPVLIKEDRDRRHDRPSRLAHAWFVGYAPADDPKVVIAVMIEYGLSGGRAAGPVFRETALNCLELGYLR